ncbi:sensor domain-containing protein [Tsukamurella strandjordii]|uniref:sensor domain-containing protein n=1 Tax=Tsukamurella strandjordii TaxID=147577 RepID=UPI0031E141B6
MRSPRRPQRWRWTRSARVVQAFGTSFAQVQQKVAASVKSATSAASVPATTTTRPATVATRTDKLLPTADSVSTLSGLQLATPRRSYERAPDVVVEPSACRPTAQPDSETTWTGAVSTTVDKYTKLQSGAESPLAFGIRAAAFGDAAAADRSYRTTENAIERCSSYMFEGATWQARRIPTPAANRLNWSINGPSAYCVTSYALVRNVILMAKQCSAKPSDSDVTGRIVDGMTTEAER